MIQERSSGHSMVSARSPYIVKASSSPFTISVSVAMPALAAAVPFALKGLKVSKVPSADRISVPPLGALGRSEEHTSELQSLMRISYAVFCLKKKKQHTSEH